MSDFAPVKELIKDVPGWLSDEEGEALYELARDCTGKGVIVQSCTRRRVPAAVPSET